MANETIEVLRIPGTLFPRGAFDENASYKFLNIVESGGSGYVCLQPCTGVPVTNTAYWFKFVFKGDKGDAFTYADLTAEQKAELVRDATAAAQAAASSAQSAADDAAAALQKFNTIKAAIDAIDPQSTEGSIQTLAAKQGLLEADLNALGPKISNISKGVSDYDSIDIKTNSDGFVLHIDDDGLKAKSIQITDGNGQNPESVAKISDLQPMVELADKIDNISKGSSSSNSIDIKTDENGFVVHIDDNGIKTKSLQITDENGLNPVPVAKISDLAPVDAIKNVTSQRPSSYDDFVQFDDEEDVYVAHIDKDGIHAKDVMIQSSRNSTGVSLAALIGVSVDVVLPPTIYVLNDRATQLFYRGFVRAKNPYNYAIKVVSPSLPISVYERYLEIIPTVAGTYSIRIIVCNDNLNVLADKTISVVVLSAPSSAPSKNVLFVGASLEAPGYPVAETYRLLNRSGGTPAGLNLGNIAFVGSMNGYASRYEGYENVYFEAHGGWSWNTYISSSLRSLRIQVSSVTGSVDRGDTVNLIEGGVSVAVYLIIETNLTAGAGEILCVNYSGGGIERDPSSSSGTLGNSNCSISFTSWVGENFAPFITNGNVDFENYADTYCNGDIDFLVCDLGINSLMSEGANIPYIISNAKTLIDAYHADFPDGKVIICLPNMPSINYPQKNDYQIRCQFWDYANALIAWSQESSYSDFIEIAAMNATMDVDNSYPIEDKAINVRSQEMESVGTNYVHPTVIGRQMMADAILPLIIKNF